MLPELKSLIFDLLKFYSNFKKTDNAQTLTEIHEHFKTLSDWMGSDDTQKIFPETLKKMTESKEAIIKRLQTNTKKDKKGRTLLLLAVEWNNIQVVQAILAAQPKLDLKDHTSAEGEMLHTLAAFKGHHEILNALLNNGSLDIHAKEQKMDALMWAASTGQCEAIKVLIKHGAYLNNGSGNLPRPTALYTATFEGKTEAVALLLELGAYKNIKYQGLNALELARQKKHTDIIAILESSPNKPITEGVAMLNDKSNAILMQNPLETLKNLVEEAKGFQNQMRDTEQEQRKAQETLAAQQTFVQKAEVEIRELRAQLEGKQIALNNQYTEIQALEKKVTTYDSNLTQIKDQLRTNAQKREVILKPMREIIDQNAQIDNALTGQGPIVRFTSPTRASSSSSSSSQSQEHVNKKAKMTQE